jgi:hypothetical protein
MARDKYDQRRVGIQVLDAVTMPVALSRNAPAPVAEGTRAAEHALLLSSRPEPQGEVALVLRSGTFSAARPLHMVLAEAAYTLEPVELIEAGEDFDWVRCRVTGKKRHAQSLPLAAAGL